MYPKDKIIKILNVIVWLFIGAAVFIMFYSFTQPSMGQELTLVALGTIAIGFGLNTISKKIKQNLDDEDAKNKLEK